MITVRERKPIDGLIAQVAGGAVDPRPDDALSDRSHSRALRECFRFDDDVGADLSRSELNKCEADTETRQAQQQVATIHYLSPFL